MNPEEKSFKSDLLYFKEEVLKDIKSELSKLTTKIDLQKNAFSEQISSFELKINLLSQKVFFITNNMQEDKSLKEKVSKLYESYQKTQDTLSLHDSKFKSQTKMIIDSMNRIDHFINNTILYTDIIGPTPNCKFQSFHKFIDYVISSITQLNNFKEKTASNDYKTFKTKIESGLETLKTQVTSISNGNNNYAKDLVEKEEESRKNMFKLYDEKISDLKMENSKYIVDMKKMIENMRKEWEKILILKNEIFDKVDKEKENLSKVDKYLEEKINKYYKLVEENNEKIKNNIKDLNQKIENIKINLKENALNKFNKEYKIIIDNKDNKNNNEMNNIKDNKEEGEKNDNDNIKKHGVESLIKKYIEGKVNFDQATHFKYLRNNKLCEDKSVMTTKIKGVKDNFDKDKTLNYSEILNNIKNNPKIKSIYNTKFKEVQTFIDRVIIGSVIKSYIKDINIKHSILNSVNNSGNLKKSNKEKLPKLWQENLDNSEDKNKLNDLKLQENTNLTNKENINTSNNDNFNDKIYESIKENKILNNSYRMNIEPKNLDFNEYFNKAIVQDLSLVKNNSYSQLLINSNNKVDIDKNLQSSINIQRMSFYKKINQNKNKDSNKNYSLDIEKNNTSNNNENSIQENIKSMHSIRLIKNEHNQINKKQSKINDIRDNSKLINILNYSYKNNSQRFLKIKDKSKTDSPMLNLLEKNISPNSIKINSNILVKNEIKNIKNINESNNSKNKLSKNNLSFYDTSVNFRNNKYIMNMASKNQIENSIKNIENQEKKKITELFKDAYK